MKTSRRSAGISSCRCGRNRTAARLRRSCPRWSTADVMTLEPHGGQVVAAAGAPLGDSRVVAILVHGRNAGPANILDLVPRLQRPGLTYLAPGAANRTWYPNSFLSDLASNEPMLSSALASLETLVGRVQAMGILRSRTVLIGFSQGACLAAEFAVRHA